jgi:hypothetical protein
MLEQLFENVLVNRDTAGAPKASFVEVSFYCDFDRFSVGVCFVSQVVGNQSKRLGLALDGRGFGCSFCEEFREVFFPAGFALFAGANVKRAVLSRLGPAADSQAFVAPTVIRFCAGNRQ